MSHRTPALTSARFFLFLFLTSLLTACAVGPDQARLQTVDFKVERGIRNGYTTDSDTSVFGLVALHREGMGSCTGTLISENVVLTARHCIAPTLDQVNGGVDCSRTTFGRPYNASHLYLTNRTVFSRDPSHYYPVGEVLIPPVGDSFCGNDIALVTLIDPVPASVATPKIPRVDTKLRDGERYYAVGYGATDHRGSGSGERRRRDSLSIDCVGDQCPSYFVEPSEWIGDTGICQGDSGGPAFDIFDRVIGVASRGAFDCDNPVYGGVFDQSEWLKESTLNAADSAGISPPKWALDWPTAPAYSHPVGAACQTGAQCNSNICIDGYCTRVCNEHSPCPGGFSCLGQCIVNPEPVIEEGGCNALNSSAAGLLWLLPLFSLLWRRKTAS